MTFQPIIFGTGLSGWQFLKATQERQQELFEKTPVLKRDTDYFAAEISRISTAKELVEDRRLLTVALGAFGLQDDINNKAFIERILAEGTTSSDALANKLADDRYKSFAGAFQFDNPIGPRTKRTNFPNEIIEKYNNQSFEISVGTQNENLRLAMNFERSLPEIAKETSSGDAAWFRVMGTPPLRKVFESALGLPSGFSQLDIDQQLNVFREKSYSRFGIKEVAEVVESQDVMSRMVQAYLLRTELESFSQSSSSSVALTLLQAIPKNSLLS